MFFVLLCRRIAYFRQNFSPLFGEGSISTQRSRRFSQRTQRLFLCAPLRKPLRPLRLKQGVHWVAAHAALGSSGDQLSCAGGRILTLPPIANLPERGCVQSTGRSTLENGGASGELRQSSLAKLLRLVFDTAALIVHPKLFTGGEERFFPARRRHL